MKAQKRRGRGRSLRATRQSQSLVRRQTTRQDCPHWYAQAGPSASFQWDKRVSGKRRVLCSGVHMSVTRHSMNRKGSQAGWIWCYFFVALSSPRSGTNTLRIVDGGVTDGVAVRSPDWCTGTVGFSLHSMMKWMWLWRDVRLYMCPATDWWPVVVDVSSNLCSKWAGTSSSSSQPLKALNELHLLATVQ